MLNYGILLTVAIKSVNKGIFEVMVLGEFE